MACRVGYLVAFGAVVRAVAFRAVVRAVVLGASSLVHSCWNPWLFVVGRWDFGHWDITPRAITRRWMSVTPS